MFRRVIRPQDFDEVKDGVAAAAGQDQIGFVESTMLHCSVDDRNCPFTPLAAVRIRDDNRFFHAVP